MRHVSLAPVICVLMLVALGAWAYRYDHVHATTPLPAVVGCPRFTTDDVTAWIVCSNEQQEKRLAALEARPPAGLSRDEVWKLAGDRYWYEVHK